MKESQKSLEAEVSVLNQANAETLRLRWRNQFRKAFPAHLPNQLIVRLLAYQMQAKAYGDLAPEQIRYLRRAAQSDGPLDRVQEGASRYQEGTVFMREHGGVTHRVVKTGGGFLWNDEEFRSLSAVANAITGAHWNGRQFFGLTDKAKRRA